MRFAPVVLTLMLAMGANTALAQDSQPDGSLEFSSTSFGLLFGYSQGRGTLLFQGRQYPFSVSGIKVATLGVSQANALGQVYRLQEVTDFAGNYAVIEGSLTLVQGGGSTLLRNGKGVTLYLQNLQYGLDLTLGGGGISITLDDEPEPAAESSPAVMEKASTP
ncbi:MAG TPA: hypothetical protein P5149_00135 [Candidatus Competibacteraceae bacterium]|nr:hypothetical protein [Candidatus Competibacteraceae bacterium]MCP5132109.1 hypothetical protein [Gammaproteobacteria bacterium]HPF58952.1 hypothetical protein [Candidatus Competibacteraceae bacterium]HRY16784.1 hypothetical protein [Candidatus Competibacteraceae bacterium]